jgi:asparagine synthase (glutamine-hydrolysing)
VLGNVLADTGWFNGAYLRRLVDEHQSGRSDHGAALWSLMMFESFLRNVCEAPRADGRERRQTSATA